MVYVLDKNNQPLMPTKKHGMVRHFLEQGLAKVVKRTPFTIKLLYDSTRYTQSLTLGIDTGSGTIGAAVSNEKSEILYASETIVRNDIKKKMDERRSYRRNRRNRKTRYRKAKFLNRKNSKKENRFSPTMTSKVNAHEREIRNIKKILPITDIVLELGSFDPHLLKDPSLADPNKRHYGYQKGPNYGYENTKAKVRSRDQYTCQHCGKRLLPLEVHHIIWRSKGGSDEEENLITLCNKCHSKVHNRGLELKINGKYRTQLRYATQMNSICKQLQRKYPDAIVTYGYVTSANRLFLNLEKTHYMDAILIATGGNRPTIQTMLYKKRCVPDGRMSQSMGIRSEKKLPKGKVNGFIRFDKILYLGKEYFIKGVMSNGYCTLMTIENKTISFKHMQRGMKTPKLTNCKRISAHSSCIITQVAI